MNVREACEALAEAVLDFPGVGVSFERGGKHNRAVVTLGKQTRFYVFPSSKMGRQSFNNVRAGLKRLCRQMQETQET